MVIKAVTKLSKMLFSFLRVNLKSILFKKKLMGKNIFIGRNVLIDPGYNWLISIGENTVIAYGCSILAHDGSLRPYTGYTRIAKVNIGSNCFIGLESLVLPGVNIGNNVIIGARSVVTKDIPDNSVAIGNPAVVVSSTHEYIEKHKKRMQTSIIYENLSQINKVKIKNELKEGNAYIKTYFEKLLLDEE